MKHDEYRQYPQRPVVEEFPTEACRTRLAGIRNPLIMKNSSTPCPPMLMVP